MTRMASDKFRSLLNSRCAELQQSLGSRDGIAIERTSDPLDKIHLATERELTTRNLERESKLLRDVRAALIRLDDETYGTCLECDEEISPKRLNAVPWTTLCLSCQELKDRNRFFGASQRFFLDAA